MIQAPRTIPEKNCVAYYRVSTRKQGKSGLGLKAQRSTVLDYVKRKGHTIVAEFTEVESGRNDNRPELIKAMELAIDHDATLVIAKLDRLSRNVSFVSKLMDEHVKFVACDMPQANELTIHIIAAMAQYERNEISRRIKEAFKAKRKREPEWKAGTPQNLTKEARQKASMTISRNAREAKENKQAYRFIKPLREKGVSYEMIAEELNDLEYRTRTKKKFEGWQVRNIYKLFEKQLS